MFPRLKTAATNGDTYNYSHHIKTVTRGIRNRISGTGTVFGTHTRAMDNVGEGAARALPYHILGAVAARLMPALLLRLAPRRFRHSHRAGNRLLHLHLEPQHQGRMA